MMWQSMHLKSRCIDCHIIGKVVEELELHSFELGTDTLPVHYVRLNDAIEIVKQGGKKIKAVE